MPNESIPVEFDCAETAELLGVLSRVLAYAGSGVAAMGAATIAARLVPLVDPRPRPTPIPPTLMSNCDPKLLARWPDVATSAAVGELAAYLVALFAALEESGTLPPRIPEIPGALGPIS